MKRIAVLALVGVVILGFNSCILDPKEGKTPPKPTEPYKPLDGERDNVFYNLQKAYTERNINRYDELLDAGFLFHFSQKDIDAGIIDPSESPWDRQAEYNANKNMFNPNFSKPDVDPVSKIDLTLTYPAGDDKWTQSEDEVTHPGEMWYEKTVMYRLTVQAGERQLVGNDIQASFVVRKATVEGYTNPIWRIVAWRDDM